jgi:hypothetical protein
MSTCPLSLAARANGEVPLLNGMSTLIRQHADHHDWERVSLSALKIPLEAMDISS